IQTEHLLDRNTPQQQYQYGLQELELFGEVQRAAAVNFICRGEVRRRTTFDDVGDEEIGAFKSSAAKNIVKWGSSGASRHGEGEPAPGEELFRFAHVLVIYPTAVSQLDRNGIFFEALEQMVQVSELVMSWAKAGRQLEQKRSQLVGFLEGKQAFQQSFRHSFLQPRGELNEPACNNGF